MSLKTVGNKEQGTWEYKDDILILTPKKMWASHYLTAKTINDPYYTVYLDYNPETMECTEWYETPEATVKSGVEREQNSEGGDYLKKVDRVGQCSLQDLEIFGYLESHFSANSSRFPRASSSVGAAYTFLRSAIRGLSSL